MSENPDNELIKFIANSIEEMRDKMATKSDIANMATKSDIARLEAKIDTQITAVRGDIEQVHLRLDGIEKTLAGRLQHIEAEVSRLRSAVYLLAKDRPEILRVLGEG